jgi:hypothetical protein
VSNFGDIESPVQPPHYKLHRFIEGAEQFVPLDRLIKISPAPMHCVSPDGTHDSLRQVCKSPRAFEFVIHEIGERARQIRRGIAQRPTSPGSGRPVHGFLGEFQGQGFVVQLAGTVEEEFDANSIRSLKKHRVYG